MVLITLLNSLTRTSGTHWRLNESMLSDPIRSTEIENSLKEYFLLNNVEDISPEVLWAAHKATIRSKIISIATQLKKERLIVIKNLENKFAALKVKHKKHTSQTLIDQLDAARLKLNLALTAKAEKHIRWSGAKFYHQKDKIGSMLASKLSPLFCTHCLPKIRVAGHPPSANPNNILETFQAFYTKLYSTTPTDKGLLVSSLLRDLPIPSLSAEHTDIMEAGFSVEEIKGVIKNLRTGSAPGPDGLSVPYYKAFADMLAPHMARFFNAKAQGYPLDPQLNTAYITVIPKPNKNIEEVENYRPISLINNDLKILTKILANCLASFISRYVHKDQVGFIPGRQGPDQIKRAIDVVSLLQSGWDRGPKQEGMLLSLDLHKAFDSVEWPYMFALMEQ